MECGAVACILHDVDLHMLVSYHPSVKGRDKELLQRSAYCKRARRTHRITLMPELRG